MQDADLDRVGRECRRAGKARGRKCRCKCDVPALKSLMYRLLANRAPTTTLHVKLRGEKLALRGELPWAETSLQLHEGQAFKAETRMVNP